MIERDGVGQLIILLSMQIDHCIPTITKFSVSMVLIFMRIFLTETKDSDSLSNKYLSSRKLAQTNANFIAQRKEQHPCRQRNLIELGLSIVTS